MDALPYYKWYWIDYRANRKVQRMSWQARGLYRELLDEFWSEGSLPTDMESLADICGCTVEEFTTLWPQMKFCWEVLENRLVNTKMDAQRTEVDTVRAAKARAGSKGGSVSNSSTRAKELQADANLFQAQPDIAEQSRAEQNKAEQEQKGSAVLRIYEAYPHKVGKGAAVKAIEKALESLRKRNEPDPEDFIIQRVKGWIEKRERDRAAGKFVPEYPNPATWFNQSRYDDEDNLPKPKKEWHVLTEEEAAAQWEKDFTLMGRPANGTANA